MEKIITLKLHSGGALGSDIAWETIGEEFGTHRGRISENLCVGPRW